jgi:hypothetical protein
MVPLARRMGIREADGARAAALLVERYLAVSGRVRNAYEQIVASDS